MSSHRIEGEATAISSVSHGGEHAGTTGYLRREKIVQPDGEVAEVPVITGNAMRGLLRDHAAWLTWAMLGKPQLSMPVFHALWSGGTLAKAGSGKVLGSRQLRELRKLCPMVALFGCAGGGRIIEGSLRVGKLVPVCAETAHIVPDDLVRGGEPSIWSLVQIEEFTRRDDAKRPTLAPVISAPELPAETQSSLDLGAAVSPIGDTEDADRVVQQMRYGVETIAAGTRFHWWMTLDNATDLEVGVLRAALSKWSNEGAHIGGRAGTGHGRLQLDIAQWVTTSMRSTGGTELADTYERQLVAHHESHRTEIVEALSWLN